MLSSSANFFKKIDLFIFIPVVALLFFGASSIYTYNNNILFEKQLIWLALSATLFLLVGRFDFSFLQNSKLIMMLYIGSNLLLVYTALFGSVYNGAKAWIDLGLFTFQPADFAKLSVVLLLAKYFSKRHIEIRFLRHILVSFIYTLFPVGLIMLQPDFGSAMVIMFIWFFVVFMSGLSRAHLLTLFGVVIISAGLMWSFVFVDYQKNRILNFVNPTRDIRGSGYNVYQAFIATGSGGLMGKGVGLGTQSKGNFLPEYQTDFVFSAYAEEWGFVGVLFIFILYITILTRLMYLAYFANNNFIALIIVGVFAWTFVHVFINISMNLGLFPVTGIPLPFMSYGGSHILIMTLAFAMISSTVKINLKNKVTSDFYLY